MAVLIGVERHSSSLGLQGKTSQQQGGDGREVLLSGARAVRITLNQLAPQPVCTPNQVVLIGQR